MLTQDQQGDSNSQGGMGIVDWGRKTCGNHLHRGWGRLPIQLGLEDWADNVEGWESPGRLLRLMEVSLNIPTL